MVRSTKIILTDINVTTPIFIIERHDLKYSIILERLFQKKGRISMWNDDHGACYGRVYDEDRDHSVEFQAVGITDVSNIGFE